jgi:hypothetical protein
MPAHCSPEDLADHDRDLRKHDTRPKDQRLAVATLVDYCEGICKSGALTEINEGQLRRLVIETLIAFDMPTAAELALS